ncbi:MAG: GTPase [Deltaproteobacteria bacterium]|nr:GTPase [Deltaproteobacteria bacterium]
MAEKKLLILGAAGRDFHNFNVVYRDDPTVRVVAFTATQIPGIDDRRYPPELAGERYPEGIPIRPQDEFEALIKKHDIDTCVFSYSDVPHQTVMLLASRVNAAGADFVLLGAQRTMIASKKPVIAVCAVRTGCGKSQTSRYIAQQLKAAGKKVAVVRHPMPYGDLAKQAVQRFGSYEDLEKHQCTIEEREEYESHVELGHPIYAGVDYGKILEQAEAEADVVIWDGGNNDTPFYKPDLWITVADPLRAGHELTYYPGATNFVGSDVIVINKAEVATAEEVALVEANAKAHNPTARVIKAASKLIVGNPDIIKGKKVLLVDDGPTVTHGEMPFGAAKVAAEQFGAKSFVDPRPFAVGSIKSTFEKYTHLSYTLPAMGYSDEQIDSLQKTINASDAEVVLFATPIDLEKLITVDKPTVRVRYELEDMSGATVGAEIEAFLKKI